MEKKFQVSFNPSFTQFKIDSGEWMYIRGKESWPIVDLIQDDLQLGEYVPSESDLRRLYKEVDRTFRLLRAGVCHGLGFHIYIKNASLVSSGDGLQGEYFETQRHWHFEVPLPSWSFEFLIFARARGLNQQYADLICSDLQRFDNSSQSKWVDCGFASKALEIKMREDQSSLRKLLNHGI